MLLIKYKINLIYYLKRIYVLKRKKIIYLNLYLEDRYNRLNLFLNK